MYQKSSNNLICVRMLLTRLKRNNASSFNLQFVLDQQTSLPTICQLDIGIRYNDEKIAIELDKELAKLLDDAQYTLLNAFAHQNDSTYLRLTFLNTNNAECVQKFMC